ncbi:hypothetical protein [Streptomyces megasporus]|uniref:hypothetical protein n=1 Tax=Streptomyces megasporus TaxID=44060 RepID=UPI000B18EF3E|nr:hypothetical protein [Streptomyces megasporus]
MGAATEPLLTMPRFSVPTSGRGRQCSEEGRRGLTALFWSNINPYGAFRLDIDKRLDLGLSITVPAPPRPPR